MRGSPFLLALCGSIAGAGNLAAQHCDSLFPTRGGVSDCSSCDDRGLLDSVDEVAGRIHQGVNRLTRTLRAELSVVRGSLGGCSSSSSCDGLDWHGGSCNHCNGGIEYETDSIIERNATPSIPQPVTNYGPSQPLHSGLQLPPSPIPIVSPAVPRQSSPVPNQPTPLPSSAPTRSPYSVPTYPPTRDSQVNPFEDEDRASNVRGASSRKIPGRTIQYQRNSHPTYRQAPPRPQPAYGQQFDTQANRNSEHSNPRNEATDSSANYWAGSEFAQALEPGRIVPASNQSPAVQKNRRPSNQVPFQDVLNAQNALRR